MLTQMKWDDGTDKSEQVARSSVPSSAGFTASAPFVRVLFIRPVALAPTRCTNRFNTSRFQFRGNALSLIISRTKMAPSAWWKLFVSLPPPPAPSVLLMTEEQALSRSSADQRPGPPVERSPVRSPPTPMNPYARHLNCNLLIYDP